MASRHKIMQAVEAHYKKVIDARIPSHREAAKKKKWGIVKGDKVQVIGTHPEKGKQGIIKQVIRWRDRVIIENVNIGKKIINADPAMGIEGEEIETERSIHYSKVNLVDPETGLPTRFSTKWLKDGTKVRVSKRSGAIIPKPEPELPDPVSSFVSESCTLEEDVWENTYDPK